MSSQSILLALGSLTCNTPTTPTTQTTTTTPNRDDLVKLIKQEKFDPTSLSNEEIIDLMVAKQVSVYRLESILGKNNAKRCVEIRRQYYFRELELLDKLDNITSSPNSSTATTAITTSATKVNNTLSNNDRRISDSTTSSDGSSPTTTIATAQQQSYFNHNNHLDPMPNNGQLIGKLDEDENCSVTTTNTSFNNNGNNTINSDNHQSRASVLRKLQTTEFDYSRVVGACCENVVGCVRIPVGLVGPLLLDNQNIYVPLATTEGCLVASTSRGMSALAKSGGVFSRIRKNCMSRAPIVRFVDPELKDAMRNVDRALDWLQDPTNKEKIKSAFQSTSKHTKLIDFTLHPIGRDIHIRFEAQTGDAMGMNMCSKGAEMALKEMQRVFPSMDILTISGNMCTDKKPSAINWIRGRGKSVECNASLSADVVEKVLKVSVDSLCDVWLRKDMVGSALAGSIGGNNCHAANIVAAIFIATGQDAAQVVSSSNCILELEKDSRGSLEVHCVMPSIECGTVGGGTVLADQSSYLQLMGIKGSTPPKDNCAIAATTTIDDVDSESNACKLAKIICATVMAAELSLLASLTEGTLVKSHMTHNRSAQPCNVV